MRIRQGRRNERNLYIQMGDEPSDADEYLAALLDPARAAFICLVMNGDIAAEKPGIFKIYTIDEYFLYAHARQLGVVFDPTRGDHMVQVLNGQMPPLSQDSLPA